MKILRTYGTQGLFFIISLTILNPAGTLAFEKEELS
jgi:hypothetical protein